MKTTANRTKTVSISLLLLVAFTGIFPLPAIADNQPPQAVGAIAPVTLIAGSGAATVDLSGSFFDPDGDILTYSAQSSNTNVVTVDTVNSTITITPVAAGVTTIIVIVQDTGGLTITENITITVNPAPNRAPVAVQTINPLTLTGGTGPTTIDMAAHFSDPDGDALTYTVVSTDTRVATVSVSNSTLTITPVAAGTTTVMIMVQDTAGLTITHNVTVTVLAAPNLAPVVVEAIDPLTLTAGADPTTIDMAAHFSDPNGDPLTYTPISADTRVATVSVSNSTLTLTPIAAGATNIMIMVRDTGGLTITRNVTVTVNPKPNTAPVAVSPVGPFTFTAGDNATTVNLSTHFSDPEGDALTYTAVSTDTRVATASVSNSTLTITPLVEGTTTVMLMVKDTSGLTITRNVTVTVNPVPNAAPVAVGTIAPFTLTAGTGATIIDMAAHFSDPNGDPLTYTAISANAAVVTAGISNSLLTLTPLAEGTATVMIMVQDTGGLTITQNITVTVNPAPNAIPTFTSAAAFSVIENITTVGTVVAVDSDDEDTITGYTVTRRADGAWFSIDPVSGELRFNTAPDFETPGDASGINQYTVVVQVVSGTDDRALTADQIIIVTVTDVNDAPLAVGTIDPVTLTVGEEEQTLDVSGKFSDPDGDALTYSAQSADTNVAMVGVEDAIITIIPGEAGTTTVTVTAFDSARLTASQPIDVTVVVAKGVGAAGSIMRLDATIAAVIDSTGLMQVNPNWTVANGDTLRLAVDVGIEGLEVTADISELDTTQSLVSLTPDKNGLYTAEISISEDNTALNGLKHILVTAADEVGNFTQLIVTSTLSNRYVTELLPNYPNPFNPETWIPYRLSEDSDVTLTIYDVSGNVVRQFNLGHQRAGNYETKAQAVYWDGTNDSGESVASGVYFYNLSIGDFSKTRKATILK
jgi:hypothetical protein